MTPAPPHTTPGEGDVEIPVDATEAEAYLCAAAMWSVDAYDTAAKLISARAFYRPGYAAIWAAVAHLRNQGLPCSPPAVADRMRQTQENIEHIRTVAWVFDLPWQPSSVTYHARMVARAAVRRHTHSAAVRAAQASTLHDHDAFRDELTRAINRLSEMASAWDAAG